MKKVIFGALAVLMTLAVLTGGIEAYVRTVVDTGMHYDLEMWRYARDVKQLAENPLIGHEHRPGARAFLMGVDVEINSKKLRGGEYPYDRTPGTTRILMLGDSLTFGWGVPLRETTAKRLEKLLLDDGVNAEVINSGVGNYNTIMETEYFFTEGKRYRPDIVILNYFINDAEPVPSYTDVGFLARNSYAYVYLKGRLDVLRRILGGGKDWTQYYKGFYADGAEGWEAASERIAALAKYCRQQGIRLLIANYPELRNLKRYPFSREERLVRKAAGRNNVAYLNLLAEIRGESEEKLWVTVSDPHPNSYANKLFAEKIFAKLKKINAF